MWRCFTRGKVDGAMLVSGEKQLQASMRRAWRGSPTLKGGPPADRCRIRHRANRWPGANPFANRSPIIGKNSAARSRRPRVIGWGSSRRCFGTFELLRHALPGVLVARVRALDAGRPAPPAIVRRLVGSLNPPGDPWALWQYIAYDYELHGRPIPEVFRPMTDTRAVHAAISNRLVQQDSTSGAARWGPATVPCRDAASPSRPRGPAPAESSTTAGCPSALRPDKPWKEPTQKLFPRTRQHAAGRFPTSPGGGASVPPSRPSCASTRTILPNTICPRTAAVLLRTAAARPRLSCDGRPLGVEPGAARDPRRWSPRAVPSGSICACDARWPRCDRRQDRRDSTGAALPV